MADMDQGAPPGGIISAPDLRPLGFGELLDRTFSYYRKRFWTFVGIMAVPQVFFIVPLLMIGLLPIIVTSGEASIVLIGVGFLGSFVVYLLAYTLAFGATTFAISEIHLGRAIAIGSAYQRARRELGRLLELFALGFVYMFGCAITIILLPVAALMPLWYVFSVPVLLLENSGARQALKRSRRMTADQRGRIFLVWLLTAIVTWVLWTVIQGPLFAVSFVLLLKHIKPPYWLGLLSQIAGGIAGAFAGPLFLIAVVLLYYDVRVRKEGYDLQLMLEALPNPDYS
jgi:hypothetical protein